MPLPAFDLNSTSWRLFASFLAGAIVGILGGLIGLGGAEFRLPLLIGLFSFVALEAVIINKAVSLVVVAGALLFRSSTVPFETVVGHWPIVVNLLAGSLLGAWLGADLATRIAAETLYRVIAVLLVLIAIVLVSSHGSQGNGHPVALGATMIAIGIAAGFAIGTIASLLGVAGGELLIPTLILLFGVDIKLAGSLSLAISLPTMLVGFARYSRDRSFAVLGANRTFVMAMAAGSIVGALAGAILLGTVSGSWLTPLLAALLLFSAAKIWRHG